MKPSGNAVKTITLRNVSGELTLSGTFKPFELDGDERKLVYDITDLMKAYEKKETASEYAYQAKLAGRSAFVGVA